MPPTSHLAMCQGNNYCLILDQELAVVAILEDGQHKYFFVHLLYCLLEARDHAMVVPSKIREVVNNGSKALLYNMSLSCGQDQDRIGVSNNFSGNFFFSSNTTVMCLVQCPVQPTSNSSAVMSF